MLKHLNSKAVIVKTYSDLQCHKLHGQTMGTHYSAVFFAGAKADKTAINAQLFTAVNQVDCQMSNWKTDSDLARLNRAPAGEWLTLPQALVFVLKTALLVSQQSAGAFDIAVGDLIQAWGFGPNHGQVNEQQLRALKAQTHQPATQALEIDPHASRVRKHAAITLDLSGIAKGYGVDQLAHCLEALGITQYLVGIDGEMRAGGTKPDGSPWSIAIEKPIRGQREVMGVMTLADASIASSGDYRHWIEHNGKTYAHTMNTALQAPVSNQLTAVSVVASSCILADAWATALLVLGEKKGCKIAQERDMDVLFVVREGDGYREIRVDQGVAA